MDVIARVHAGKAVEDYRVELKREWPDPAKAARRIAAHSNASFGSDVLWILGVDEDTGTVGVVPEELANWWPSVTSHFDGVGPSLTHITLSIEGKTVVCLLFDTGRPPYVTKNPQYGKSGSGPVSLEVPWREGTSVRSATRNDLIRLLVPTTSQPELEILGGYGTLRQEKHYPHEGIIGVRLSIDVSCYIFPRDEASIVIPFHKCTTELIDGYEGHAFDELEFSMRHPYAMHIHQGSTPDTVTIESTSSELLAHGPGRCRIEVRAALKNELDWFQSSNLLLRFSIFIINCELPLEFQVALVPRDKRNDEIRRWSIEARS
ncbi:MAG: hypothetical protein RLN61_15170 [Algiphilus sp.]